MNEKEGQAGCGEAGAQIEEIGFFHLTRSPVERALPRLCGRLLERGERILLKCPDAASAEALDRFLWTFDPDSFLPHGRLGEGREGDQPILITHEDTAPVNDARVAIVIAPAQLPGSDVLSRLRRIAYLFDGRDPALVETARSVYREAAVVAGRRRYWQQDAQGRWVLAHEDGGGSPGVGAAAGEASGQDAAS